MSTKFNSDPSGQQPKAYSPSVFYDLNALAIGSGATAATPASGKKLRLLSMTISVSAVASVVFTNNAVGGAVVFRTPKLLIDTPYNFYLGDEGVSLGKADNVLKATSSAGANITGTLCGVEE